MQGTWKTFPNLKNGEHIIEGSGYTGLFDADGRQIVRVRQGTPLTSCVLVDARREEEFLTIEQAMAWAEKYEPEKCGLTTRKVLEYLNGKLPVDS